MAKVLVAAWGTRGDCQSAATIAGALGARGHDVCFAAPRFMARDRAVAAVPFTPLGDDPLEWFEAKASRRHTDPRLVLPRLLPVFARQVRPQFETLAALGEGADVVVAQGLAYAAPSVADAVGAVYHYLSPNPFFFASRHHPPLNSKRVSLPDWMNRLSWRQFSVFYNVVFRRNINRHRRGLGLAPVGDVASHVFDATRAIAAFDPELYDPPPDVAAALPHIPVGSIPVPCDEADLDDETRAFLDAGPPVVAVDFGSMPDHAPEKTSRALVEGARAAGARVVLSRGWAGLRVPQAHVAPRDVHIVSSVPHSVLFPKVDVVVHHGGVGTAATAARAGVPQLVVPHAYDQYASAYRLQQAGLALAPLPRPKLDASRFAEALVRTLSDGQLGARATSVAAAIAARDPLSDSIAVIEASLRRR